MYIREKKGIVFICIDSGLLLLFIGYLLGFFYRNVFVCFGSWFVRVIFFLRLDFCLLFLGVDLGGVYLVE